jgi:HSP20 family protein
MGMQAALVVRAAKFTGQGATDGAAASPDQDRSSTMIFAPALRTRSFVPARGFDRSFERFLSDSFFAPVTGSLKVEQNEEAWTVSLDVPGVSREQLTIDVDGAVVRVATIQDAPRQYQAAYELPAEIDAEATSAKLENGVLTLSLGKKKPVVTSRQIEVK